MTKPLKELMQEAGASVQRATEMLKLIGEKMRAGSPVSDAERSEYEAEQERAIALGNEVVSRMELGEKP
jgi:hypothetical protein